MDTEFDVIVIGAGPVGENVAARVVAGGLTAAIVEAELVGGECSYWACMPSKAMLRPGAALAAARAVDGAKQAVTGDLDAAAVFARRTSFTSNWNDDGQVSWLESAGIPLLRGHGQLAGDRTVEVVPADGASENSPTLTLHARTAVVLATGSDAIVPELPGVAEANVWTSREATSADSAPRRLVVVGAGVVGCEMATAYADLGSAVTLLVRHDRLLSTVEPFAGEMIADALRKSGVDIRTDTEVQEVHRAENGVVTVTVSGGDTIEAEEILFATGRRPRSHDLALDTVGVDGTAPLSIDDTGQVDGVDWLYAVGDVAGRVLLTHMGKYQARMCATALLDRAAGRTPDTTRYGAAVSTADHTAVTQVVFTGLEVAAVGPTEEQARAAGITVKAVEYDLAAVAGSALHSDEFVGRAKMLVDEDRSVIIGVTFVGPGVGELLHAATVAVVGEVPLDRLWHAIPAYPTVSEIWLRLLETYGL